MRSVLRNRLIIADKIIILLIFLLLGIYRPDFILGLALLFVISYLVFTKRVILLNHLLVAFLVALVWVLLASNQYSYNKDFLILFGFNSFPLFAWSLGLFAMYVIYSYYEKSLNSESYLSKILLFSALYWPLLLIAEKIGFEIFNIQNIAASGYETLAVCNCLHAAPWMQFSYLFLGPLFFSICYLLRLENPHK